MAPHVNALIATLDLICAPIPNSRVSEISENADAVRILRQSDFYMIGARATCLFTGIFQSDNGKIGFTLQVQGGKKGTGFIDVLKLPPIKKLEGSANISVGYSEHFISLSKIENDDKITPLAVLSPEDLLWRRGRQEPFISGLDNHLELASYDLLYVGIATQTDSYARLIAKGHQARQEILSNEPQRYPGARVSDEIFLFLFTAEPLLIKSWGPNDTIDNGDLEMSYNNNRLVADAEKAFISILRPKYNSQLYSNYPKGKDGIYSEGYTGYTYSLSDGIILRTQYGSMKGAREGELTLSNNADFISIQGDSVKLHIAGIDYEIEA
ncbi:hypothetical protein O9649_10315 [Achromobacter dolens]|uniref:hypothetical protein n=1 Tax=Achromobacter dolens TaxID=1287738 RepID=UPI0022B8D650|nr:hypothetical protein [Achromobacter dolens]MCZ8408182.1 hypothetical protein [Achromobacter dolens]